MDEPTVVVGRIMKPHGIGGELAVENRSDNPARWDPGSVVFLGDGRSLTVAAARPHSGRLLVSFAGINDRIAADGYRGQLLMVPESWLPVLGPGEWWPSQLIGCRVLTDRGGELGQIADVIPNPANDLWVALDDEGTETLIPALQDLLIDVDVEGKRIVVRAVPGLTTPTPPEADP
jgi:16S rRNA processing protein RimM